MMIDDEGDLHIPEDAHLEQSYEDSFGVNGYDEWDEGSFDDGLGPFDDDDEDAQAIQGDITANHPARWRR